MTLYRQVIDSPLVLRKPDQSHLGSHFHGWQPGNNSTRMHFFRNFMNQTNTTFLEFMFMNENSFIHNAGIPHQNSYVEDQKSIRLRDHSLTEFYPSYIFFLTVPQPPGERGNEPAQRSFQKYSRPSLQAEPSGTFSIFVWTVFRLNLQRFLNVLLEFGFF